MDVAPRASTVPTWRLWVAPIVWAVHFLGIYAMAALACARQGSAGAYTTAAVPWLVSAATLVASGILVWVFIGARRAGRNAESTSRRFVEWLAAALAALVLVAVIWETLALVWVPVCGN